MSLTKKQKWLLDCACDFIVGVYPDEVRTMRSLERKGLVSVEDGGPADTGMIRYYAKATAAGRIQRTTLHIRDAQ